MDLQLFNKISSKKKLIDNRKKMIIIGVIISAIVLIIPAIGLHFLATDAIPSDSKEKLDAGSEIENNNKEETKEFVTENSTNETTQSSNETQENNAQTQTNNKDTSEENNENDDSNQYNPPNGGGSSFTPPSNSGGSSGNSGSDVTSTEEDDDEEETSSNGSDCIIELPDYQVNALVDLIMNETYFKTNLTGIYGSYDIQNNSYDTWCIDYGNYMNYSLKKVHLYSSYCPPESYQLPIENWSAVNYILNHKPENITYLDIQTAIWYYVNFGSTPQEPTDKAWDIINDVESNDGGSFIPETGEIIAVIVESNLDPGNDQLSIIENQIPQTSVISRLNLEKTANKTNAKIGDMINYSYIIENTGESTIDSLMLTDDKLGNISITKTLIDPGETVQGWKTYIVSEDDIPGPIINTATVTGITNDNQSISVYDNETVFISYTPQIVLDKQVSVNSASIGEEITYSYNITNTGDVSLFSITLIDDKLGNIILENTTLLPGTWMVVTKNYTILETDLPGPLVNIAEVSAIDYADQSVMCNDSVSICLQYHASISLTKQADIHHATLGSMVNYSYLITNTGDVSLENIVLFDDKIGDISLPITILQPSENLLVTSPYTITCSDLENTTLTNTAVINATTVFSELVTNMTSEQINLSYHPNITMEKSVQDHYDNSWKKDLTVIEDNVLLFNITIENTGEETLHNILLKDKLPDQLSYANDANLPPTSVTGNIIEWMIYTLEKNESITITYSAKATQLGIGENNATTEIEICTGSLMVTDKVTITVLPCPTEVWVKHDWNNQSDVDEYDDSLTYHYNAFKSINYAITAVCDCATVHVLSGVYGEQVFVNKNISLIGENTETTYLHSGTNPETINIPESDQLITPVVLAYGGSLDQTNTIQGSETISFSIEGFTFLAGSSDTSTAVALRNVQSGCVGNAITNTSSSNVHIGFQLWNSSSVLIDKNYVENSDFGIVIDARSDYIDVTHNWLLDNEVGVKIINNSQQTPNDIGINFNYIDTYCSNDYGLINEISSFIVNATHNWWGSSDGPNSAPESEIIDPFTGRIAESVDGEYLSGPVHFDRWSGVGAVPLVSQLEASVGSYIYFDASDSWAEAGYIGPEDWNSDNENFVLKDNPLTISQYKWNFGDGTYGYEKSLVHQYDSPGNYTVMLRVRSSNVYLDRCDGFRPSEDGIIYGYVYFNILINE